MPDCHLCRGPITTGETRQAITTASGQAVTVHQTCHIPPSPATRFEAARIDDEVTLTANGTEVVGTIAGTGMVHTPARGRYLFVEAAPGRNWVTPTTTAARPAAGVAPRTETG